MLAAAIPFPKEETTPPVTKMNLDMLEKCRFEQLGDAFQIFRRVYSEGFVISFNNPDLIAVLDRP
jgi:hypothetical protein